MRHSSTVRMLALTPFAVGMIVGAGCPGGEPPDEPADSNRVIGSGGSDAPGSAPELPPYEGAPFDFTVETGGTWTQFRWSVEVPTGGWSLSFKRARTTSTHATIMVILRPPPPDAMVTQAFVRHDGDYRHGRVAFETAELLVAVLDRGVDETDEAYRRAATWP